MKSALTLYRSNMNNDDVITVMRRRCESMILSMVGAELAPDWWNRKNYAFDGVTPNEMFEQDPERVYRYICGHVDGYW